MTSDDIVKFIGLITDMQVSLVKARMMFRMHKAPVQGLSHTGRMTFTDKSFSIIDDTLRDLSDISLNELKELSDES